jgi:hypothetical protein
MKYELVKENKYQRFYRMPIRIKIGRKYSYLFHSEGNIELEKLYTEYPKKLKPGYEYVRDPREGADYVCVSDAHTHIERLVFPAFEIRNIETGEIILINICDNIEGQNTMMIHGGDITTVEPDENYLDRLYKLNDGRKE